MTTYNGFKVVALAAAIALAMGSTAVMAADPATTQLPGVGAITGTVTAGAIVAGEQTLTVTGLTNVINWGKTGGTINATGADAQPAGFNIGSGAKLHFSSAAAAAVLNVDSSGNPSQILGTLNDTGVGHTSIFVANSNGIIVGSAANITSTGAVGLIANTLDSTPSFTGATATGGLVYNGTGGDVTVQTGATVSGTTVFIAGAGNVNVDLGKVSGTTTLSAGTNSGGSFTTKNSAASLSVTGAATGSAATLNSAGTAKTTGKLTVAGGTVAGLLTNTGDLTLGAVNGKVHNQGQLRSSGAVGFTALTNDGDYATTGPSAVSVLGGDLTNNGTMTADGTVTVTNGSIVNNGAITGARDFEVISDSTLASFTTGADYSITNTGTITSSHILEFDANDQYNQNSAVGPQELNGSTGSFTNTGKLQVPSLFGGGLVVYANNDINLGGLVQTNTGGTVKAVSATNPLGVLILAAANYYLNSVFTSDGVLTVSTPLAVESNAQLWGNQVKLMDNVSAVDATGAPDHYVYIVAGAAQATDYAVRVASGKTVSAGEIQVDGDQTGNEPNAILQGTLLGNRIVFGSSHQVSDVFSGPAGGLSMYGTPVLTLDFTGAVKTAKYNNASNFRFNGLTVNVTDGSPLYVLLNPSAYKTNGTSNGLSAVNLLVNSDVDLDSGIGSTVLANGTAVTGVTNTPNTHLVLQSSGKIRAGDSGDFYWPGYVYLGNVAVDTGGHALPGTLGDGGITTVGTFNNVLPGDIAGASGIHFITGKPLVLGGDVVTNANAWVNFGTDLLTQNYASGMLGSGLFFGGVKGSGNVVNYDDLDPSMFNTHAPDATR